MINRDKISNWWRDLFRRRRLSLFSNRDHREVWYTHISPANIFMAVIATFVLIFIAVLTLVSYSPILEILPGYRNRAIETRRSVIESIVRIDSMERVINNMMIYSDNVSHIMSGNTPDLIESLSTDTMLVSKSVVLRNGADSALRAEMEGDGRYSIHASLLSGEEPMVMPVDGVVTRRFDISESSYGVEIAAAEGGRVVAAQRGVVIMADWTINSDYIVEIMHSNNLVSIYRNIKNITVERGDNVKAGGVIGYNHDNTGAATDSRAVVFEIWSNGKPIDPERYIIF